MLEAAMTRLHEIVNTAFPFGVRLHPDNRTTFEAALTASAGGQSVCRYYQPQLLRISGEAYFLCTVDVIAPTSDAAMRDASVLLSVVHATPRAPNGVLTPRAVAIPETSYHRVSVSFTIHTPIPSPVEGS